MSMAKNNALQINCIHMEANFILIVCVPLETLYIRYFFLELNVLKLILSIYKFKIET